MRSFFQTPVNNIIANIILQKIKIIRCEIGKKQLFSASIFKKIHWTTSIVRKKINNWELNSPSLYLLDYIDSEPEQ